MSKLTTKLATGLAVGALVASAFAPMAFADSTISGNGASSQNSVSQDTSSFNTVSQTNNAMVTNMVTSNSSTGGNSASSNTGGSASLTTGSTSTVVQVNNQLNKNAAVMPSTTPLMTDGVTVSGNGESSHNGVHIDSTEVNTLGQTNSAMVMNAVEVGANTGNNALNSNTGNVNGGSQVSATTGSTSVGVGITTMANANLAVMGSTSQTPVLGGDSILISGNGASSHNWVHEDQDVHNTLGQSNFASVMNNVGVSANTGNNTENSNTGVGVALHTGNTVGLAQLDTAANFNIASIGSDVVMGGSDATISGNGASSHNYFHDDLLSVNSLGQANMAGVTNMGGFDQTTGDNAQNSNTGGVGSSVSATTGSAMDQTLTQTMGNLNFAGPTLTIGGVPVGFNLDFGSLANLFF